MDRRIRKSNYREKLVKELVFAIFTITLILGIAFFACGTVVSQADGKITVDEECYQVLEKEYVKEIRSFLTEQGYENSGVNLTMVTDEKGARYYQVEVHHKRINRMSQTEKEALLEKIENMAFQVEGCNFEISVLL